MADLTPVYAALEAADKAGNTADAKQLADYIRSQSSDAAPAPAVGPKPVTPDKDGLSDVQRSLLAGDSDNLSEGAPGLTDAAKGAVTGVNAGGFDMLGLPMDTATNAANLIKAPLGYVASKFTKDGTVPQLLQADDPADVPGTSSYLQNKANAASKALGGASLTEAPDSVTGQAAHMIGEIAGPGPLAEATLGRKAPPLNVNAAGKVVDAPVIGTTGTTGVKPGTGSPLETLRGAGYKVRATDVTAANPGDPAGTLATVAESVGGSKQQQKENILHNQQISTELGGQVLNKPGAIKLNTEDFEKAKEGPAAVYDGMGSKLGTFAPSPEVEMALEGVAGSSAVAPGAGTEARKLLKKIQNGEDFEGPEFMSTIQRLRRMKDGDQVTGPLEDEVHRQLQERDPGALQDYQAARKKFAQIYTVQDNTRRGQLNATEIGNIHQQNPQLLEGPLRVVGIAANEAPGVLKMPSTAPGDTLDKISSALHVLTTPVRKALNSNWAQDKLTGAQVADPVTASYIGDAGKRPDAPTTRPPAPLPQISYQPGQAPMPAGAEIDAGAPRAPVNNPAELNSVLSQVGQGVAQNPPAASVPPVSPVKGQLALPAPGQLAQPNAVQPAPVFVTPEGSARLNDPVRDFIADQATNGAGNPAEARRAAISTILKNQNGAPPAGSAPSRSPVTSPAELKKLLGEVEAKEQPSITDARRKYIIDALRNSP